MSWIKLAFIGSAFVGHMALLAGMSLVPQKKPDKQSAIGVFVAPKQPKKAEPEPPPKPIEAPEEVLKSPKQPRRAAAPKPAPVPEAAPPPGPAPRAALAALPDLGISLSGSSSGTGAGGIAVPSSPAGGHAPEPKRQEPPKEKVLSRAPAIAQAAGCDEPIVKAKQTNFVQPTYTDAARSAEIEGKVKLELSIDAQGNVTSVKVLSGLGHGLDESAIAAAKRVKFTAATACGNPVASTFVVQMRFGLGE